ncbi:hypothetical protein [Vibrio caribbeanicus]|uniref:Uncharacterized protein n=1 Tax=Vibrio caribbeanicus ATCC BAA-2122 TaxID=796620 RepID=E3BGW8_9VIBR|nr:hypothetical protein VIBC2010_06104 [Vibrio caribbeanicus ATCC BAA-2122]
MKNFSIRTLIFFHTLAMGTLSFPASANINSGTVLDNSHSAKVHDLVGNFRQTRHASGYLTYTGGQILGNTDNEFTLQVGPHDTSIGTVIGTSNLSFNPQEIDCVRGLHLSLTVNETTPFSISPTCEALLKTDLKRTFSHTVATLEVPISEVPIDPAGVFKLGVKVGAVLKTGADFAAGLEVGGFDKPNNPIEINGNRRPDFVYASVRPFVSGDATAKGYAMLNSIVKTVEKGVKGKINLINAGTKAHAEAGITYREGSSEDFQYYTRLKWDASAKGGDGEIGLYCKVKAFGIADIFNAETSLVSWSPIWELEHTIYDKKTYI